jgi:hypothetical protein
METETLVEALAADTVVPWKLEQSIRLALIAGNIIAAITFFGGIGFRPDIVFAMGTTRFLVKFAVTLPLAFAATAALLRVAQPGASFGVRGWALALSPIILMSAVLIELVTVPPPLWGSRIMGTHAHNCLTLIPLLSSGLWSAFYSHYAKEPRRGLAWQEPLPGLPRAELRRPFTQPIAPMTVLSSLLPGIHSRQDL